MAREQGGVNKSKAIRELLTKNPEMSVKEVMSTLAGQKIKVHANLVYFVKGKMKGRKGRRRRVLKEVPAVAATHSANGDALSTILKVKKVAVEVGGLKKLKSLVEALSE